jgi:hypothetical protein
MKHTKWRKVTNCNFEYGIDQISLQKFTAIKIRNDKMGKRSVTNPSKMMQGGSTIGTELNISPHPVLWRVDRRLVGYHACF